jgi:putative hydrolase of HD superfamily
VTLRDWRLADLEVYAHWMAPGHRWQDFDGPYFPKPTPEEQAQELERRRAAILAGTWPEPRRRMVVADAATDEMLGTVSWYWIGKETDWLALGILIFDPDRWSRGLGAAALRQWCDYLWSAMPRLVRLDLQTWSGNPGMMRLAEKLGFKLEARYRKARVVDGRYYDALGYGVLREEWVGTAQ